MLPSVSKELGSSNPECGTLHALGTFQRELGKACWSVNDSEKDLFAELWVAEQMLKTDGTEEQLKFGRSSLGSPTTGGGKWYCTVSRADARRSHALALKFSATHTALIVKSIFPDALSRCPM